MRPFRNRRHIERSVLLALLLGVLAAGPAAAVDLGDPAPDFTLSDIFGTSYTLSEMRGNVVFLFMVGYG